MQATNPLYIIMIFLTVGLILIFWQVKKMSEPKKDETTDLLMKLIKQIQDSSDKTSHNTQRQLAETTQSLNERLDKAASVIANVSKSVGEMTELGRSMKELQEFLRAPKLRGQIGESVLKDLLGQALPKQNFHLQYAFKGGEIVDAALKIEQGIIPIDAKFPMENFRKMAKAEGEKERAEFRKIFTNDVKKHIDAISSKYIRPSEGTLDFALMYIPSEPIYYEILTNSPELDDYAYKKRVRPVSPNTLYAYLRAIIMSLEGSKIEKQTGQILSALREIGDETEKFGTSLLLLTKHIKNAASTSDDVTSRFSRLSTKISSVQSFEEKVVKRIKSDE